MPGRRYKRAASSRSAHSVAFQHHLAARGVHPLGRVVIEYFVPLMLETPWANLQRAGVADRVGGRRSALDTLPTLPAACPTWCSSTPTKRTSHIRG